MSRNEKLALIVAKCRELIALADRRLIELGPSSSSEVLIMALAIAGWRSTIAAIEGFTTLSKWHFENTFYAEKALDAIADAWTEELL